MKCEPFNRTIQADSLAKAYVARQKMCELLEPTEALLAGTIFPELVM